MSEDTAANDTTQNTHTREKGEAVTTLRPEDAKAANIDEIFMDHAERLIPTAVEALNAAVNKIELDIENMQDAKRHIRNTIRTVQTLRTDLPMNIELRGQLLLEAIRAHSPRLWEDLGEHNASIEDLDKQVALLMRMALLTGTKPDISAYLEASEALGALGRALQAVERRKHERTGIIDLERDVLQLYRYQIAMMLPIAGQNATQTGPDTED